MTLIPKHILGHSLAEREKYLKKIMTELPTGKQYDYPISYKKNRETIHCPVYEIDIEYVIYRLSNIRTKSGQKVYIEDNHKDADFFEKDAESRLALQAQHEILFQISNTGDEYLNHYKNFINGERFKQSEPILINSSGIMINGNTRLSAIKQILSDTNNTSRYSHLNKVWAAILPTTTTPTQEREIEMYLQVQPDWKKDYEWTSMALDVRDRFRIEGDLAKIVSDYGIKKGATNHPKSLIKQIEVADIYLESIGKKSMYNLVDKKQYAFDSWAKLREKYNTDPIEQKNIDISISAYIFRHSEGQLGKGDVFKKLQKISKNWESDRKSRDAENIRKINKNNLSPSNTSKKTITKTKTNPFNPSVSGKEPNTSSNQSPDLSKLTKEEIANTINDVRITKEQENKIIEKENKLASFVIDISMKLKSISEGDFVESASSDSLIEAKQNLNEIILSSNELISKIDKLNDDD